jgi:hypothetical protein
MSVRFWLIDAVGEEQLRPQSGYSNQSASNQSTKKFKKNSKYLKIEKSNFVQNWNSGFQSLLTGLRMPTSEVVLGYYQLVKGTTL